ncbi:NAD(P)/FAD-dependent oxidoreductase [Streptomyces sp. KAI-26]|uniref:flavin-containing monooxygenase n=1 Tax=Streptomyces TaxID=1883 RepID=UPI0011520603|nr:MULTISPECIES: NAD(P)/FAD-dependent oxidoreductase [Streptomyces]NUV90432.1 NAD(P)/FAD-dependent oxidoreductase [Streptomyces sp. KAI-26]NUW24323.1 NAD(P)/FAD-dependent oxidoreductase [Streptomyces roseoviolaceus]TQO33668.1 cation diffusion facilitator CzcD-associated flavoprotein CzcO [Streptomyces cavourensis]GGU63948.1 Baeyer-Villiger monooxygenase [Streptomyces cavourensis]
MTPPHAPAPHELVALRQRYRLERERRVRPDGMAQYRDTDAEFGYYAADPYTGPTERAARRDTVDVAVIGGGFGGILAGARLRQQGVRSIRIVERGGDVGGTWYWNRYPGVHCDIESHVYLPLLDETGYVPEWKYAPGEEIRQHAVRIAERFGLYADALFSTQVTSLTWDEASETWTVTTDRGDAFRAAYVVNATGTLTEPKLPGIPGIETFRGHTFHTSRWDYGYTGGTPEGGMSGLADKRVGIVGTGATGIQVIPMLARDAAHLYVFQRTPSTVDVRANRRTTAEDVGADREGWARRRRENYLRIVSGEPEEQDLVADRWTASAGLLEKLLPSFRRQGDREAFEEAYEAADAAKMNELRQRVERTVTDPETAEKLKPWYRYACKRPTFSDLYYPAFNRDNVTLIDTADTHGIERITERGVVVGDTVLEVDCLIFATGFFVGASGIHTGKLPVHGRGGTQLLHRWARQGPRTLHGFTSSGFPNLIQMGSFQNASSVNFTHVLDEQAVHAAALVAAAEARNALVEPSPEAEDAWNTAIGKDAPDHEWFHAECTPGYYNREGRGRPNGPTAYPHGAVAFHRLLADWREHSIGEALRARTTPRPSDSHRGGTAD